MACAQLHAMLPASIAEWVLQKLWKVAKGDSSGSVRVRALTLIAVSWGYLETGTL